MGKGVTIILLLSLTSVACAYMSSLDSAGTYVGVDRYSPVPADMVRILDEEEMERSRHVRVAVIEATGTYKKASRVALIEELKKRAGDMGANAIVYPLVEIEQESDGLTAPRTATAKTIAIRLLDD